MKFSARPLGMTKLIGGRLFLDFINTVGGRDATGIQQEKLVEYADLLAWSRRAEILSETNAKKLLRLSENQPAAAQKVWRRAVALRETLYRICRATINRKTPAPFDLAALNRELDLAFARQSLQSGGTGKFIWQWTDETVALDAPLWHVAESAAEFFTTADLTRLRQCGGENCGWLFEDTSRNRRRAWCDMRDCGNLVKVRRFRAKK